MALDKTSNYKTKTFEIPEYLIASDIERLIKIGNGEIIQSDLIYHCSDFPGAPQITVRALEEDFENIQKALERLVTW